MFLKIPFLWGAIVSSKDRRIFGSVIENLI